MPTSPSVLVYHATSLVRAALCALLTHVGNLTLIDGVSDIDRLLPLVSATQPELILHGGTADLSVCAVAERLRVRCPTAKLIALIDEREPFCPPAVIEAHFYGALLVTEIDEQIVAMIQLVAHGHTSFSRMVVEKLLSSDIHPLSVKETTRLTEREQEILTLMVDGLAAEEIAKRLALTRQSVWNAVSRIYRKLGVAGRAEAVMRGRALVY